MSGVGAMAAPPARRARARLEMAIHLVALVTVGAKWVSIGNVGPFALEVANIGTLLVLLLGTLHWIRIGHLRMPLPLNLAVLLLLVLAFAIVVRGPMTPIILMSLAATGAAYVIANLDTLPTRAIILGAFLGFVLLIVLSVLVAGVDYPRALAEFLATGNRQRYAHQGLLPIYNAFAGGPSSAAGYTTVLNNTVGATFALFYILAGSHALGGDRAMIPVAMLALAGVVLVFSSSATLVCIAATLLFALAWMRQRHGAWQRYLVFVALIPPVMLLGPALVDYLVLGFADDAGTRDARLIQYTGALDVINTRMLTGAGLVQIDGNVIHNLFLFSFATAGLAGGILSAALLVAAAGISAAGMRALFDDRSDTVVALLAAALPILFIVRSLVGGAGGLPAAAGILALGYAIVAHRGLRRAARSRRDVPARSGRAGRGTGLVRVQ